MAHIHDSQCHLDENNLINGTVKRLCTFLEQLNENM